MRIGEVLGLEVSKIDFDNFIIKIRQTLFHNNLGEAILQPPKTKKSIRDIVIDKEISQILRYWVVEQKE